MKYGYARVSTKEQNEERQIIALKEQGVDVKHIFIDKQSGKGFERTAYRRLLRRLQPGDALFAKSIDRLALLQFTFFFIRIKALNQGNYKGLFSYSLDYSLEIL